MNIKNFNQFIKESVSLTFNDLVEENTYILDEMVYHGSPLSSFYRILQEGIMGYEHREMTETSIVCTSLNSSVFTTFSEHNCGLAYNIKNAKVFILPEWLRAILDSESGASRYEEYEEAELAEYCKQYNIPFVERYGDKVRLPYNYIQDNLPVGYIGTMYEYTAEGNYSYRDEAEITFMGSGIDLLNQSIYSIYIDGKDFEEPEEAISYLQETYSEEELEMEF